MRYALAALGTVFAISLIHIPTPAEARDYPYCIRRWGEPGPGDCRFTSFRQCQATSSGLNADCFRNSRIAFGQQRRTRR
jgi:Protein of unknown function (DUF3551)